MCIRDRNGFTCDTAYRFDQTDPNTVCQGGPLACDSDCSFNGEDSTACNCRCTEDLDCIFPDTVFPENADLGGRPIGVDCTLYWCDKGNCPCDHLASPDEFDDCIFAAEDDPTISDACDRFSNCVN